MSSYEPPRPLSSLKFSISQSRNYLVYFGVFIFFIFKFNKPIYYILMCENNFHNNKEPPDCKTISIFQYNNIHIFPIYSHSLESISCADFAYWQNEYKNCDFVSDYCLFNRVHTSIKSIIL